MQVPMLDAFLFYIAGLFGYLSQPLFCVLQERAFEYVEQLMMSPGFSLDEKKAVENEVMSRIKVRFLIGWIAENAMGLQDTFGCHLTSCCTEGDKICCRDLAREPVSSHVCWETEHGCRPGWPCGVIYMSWSWGTPPPHT